MQARRFILTTTLCAAALLLSCWLTIGYAKPPAGAISRESDAEPASATSTAKSTGPASAEADGIAAGLRPVLQEKPRYHNASYRGKVVWLADALQRRFQIKTDSDARHSMVALESPDGTIRPIVKDNRGRGFMIDPRLRDVDMELYVRQYEGSPMIQVMRVYTLKNGHKYELDYWCDVCSIVMYEKKQCECCQETNRIRERLVEEDTSAR